MRISELDPESVVLLGALAWFASMPAHVTADTLGERVTGT
jgi:hypothetical protein